MSLHLEKVTMSYSGSNWHSTPTSMSITIHPNYFKGNSDNLKELLQKVDCDEVRDQTVDVKYSHMTDHLSKIAHDCFPKSRRKGSRKNIYINGQALRLKAKKEKLWGTYRKSKCA